MDPSLSDLRYFQEVAKTGNISRAAERLMIRQSSLSEAMRRLEGNVGARLLTRSKTGVSLTKAGFLFLDSAAAMVQQWEELKSSVNRAEKVVAGHYSIGSHPTPASYILPAFLPALLDQHEDLRIRLMHARSQELNEMVISRKLDFAIVTMNYPHPDLVIAPLISDRIGFWAHHKMPAAPEKSTLIFDPEIRQAQEVLKELSRRKIRFLHLLTSSSVEVVREMAEQGAGVAILPENPVKYSRQSSLRLLNELPQAKSGVSLIYRADAPKSLAASTIARAIREGCARLGSKENRKNPGSK
jgi:LysR family transcriptional regulator, cell division regulator